MSPDDKRHGMVAGYRAGCRDVCCRRAIAVYNETLKLSRLRGERPRLVPIVGARRRLEALAWLGWSHAQIAMRLGYCRVTLAAMMRKHDLIAAATHDRIAAVFEELCMTSPPETTPAERMSVQRTKARARRLGYVPALMWDDIDTDPAPASVTKLKHTPKSDVDEAVVLRVMAGERLPMTTGERVEVVARLRARGWSLNEIETRCHIGKPERYQHRGVA